MISNTKTLPESYHSTTTASWERIFDLDWADEDVTSPRQSRAIQAVFWKLRREHVVRVDLFTAR